MIVEYTPSIDDVVRGRREEKGRDHSIILMVMDTPSTSTDRYRIMSLEQELAATKQQLALSKCAQDSVMCELVKTNAALVKATTSEDGYPDNADTARTFNISGTKTVTVPTMNPFSRKEAPTKKKTVLNPGSCSSAMDLLNIMSESFNTNHNEGSLIRGRTSQKRTATQASLNPGSCASALNLIDINFDETQRAMRMSNITSSFDKSLSSFERLSSSLPSNTNNGGLSRQSRGSNTSSNIGKRNAEWGEFK